MGDPITISQYSNAPIPAFLFGSFSLCDKEKEPKEKQDGPSHGLSAFPTFPESAGILHTGAVDGFFGVIFSKDCL